MKALFKAGHGLARMLDDRAGKVGKITCAHKSREERNTAIKGELQ
jgi:hypothetical protein